MNYVQLKIHDMSSVLHPADAYALVLEEVNGIRKLPIIIGTIFSIAMPLFFFLLFLVLVVGNSYMITRLLQGFPIIPTWGTILVWGLLFLPIVLFIATFCLNKEVMSYSLMRFGYLIGSSWLFFVLYMVIGLLIIDLFRIWFFIPYSSSIIVLCITIL